MKCIALIFICFYTNTYAQNLTGRVVYQQVTNTFFDKNFNSKPEVIVYELYFDNTSSNYNNYAFADTATLPARTASSLPGKYRKHTIIKELAANELKNALRFKAGTFICPEPLPELDWSVSNETKKLGSFTCTKATCTFRGRDYTAWFTPEIPVSHGPWKLHGLPGLILEAHDELNEVQFLSNLVEVPNSEATSILTKALSNPTVVPFEEYKENPENFDIKAFDRHIQDMLKSSGSKSTVTISANPSKMPIELSFEQ